MAAVFSQPLRVPPAEFGEHEQVGLLALPEDVLSAILKHLQDSENIRLACHQLRDKHASICSSLTLSLRQQDSDSYLASTVPACLRRYTGVTHLSLEIEAPFKVQMALNSHRWASLLPSLLHSLSSLRKLHLQLAEAGYAWEHEHWSAIAEAARSAHCKDLQIRLTLCVFNSQIRSSTEVQSVG